MEYTALNAYSTKRVHVQPQPAQSQPAIPSMFELDAGRFMAISPTTGELMVPGNPGVVVQANSGNQAIRISGTATTTSGVIGPGSTAKQIQFYSSGNIVSAFDQNGLYMVDNSSIFIGNGTVYSSISSIAGAMTLNSALPMTIASYGNGNLNILSNGTAPAIQFFCGNGITGSTRVMALQTGSINFAGNIIVSAGGGNPGNISAPGGTISAPTMITNGLTINQTGINLTGYIFPSSVPNWSTQIGGIMTALPASPENSLTSSFLVQFQFTGNNALYGGSHIIYFRINFPTAPSGYTYSHGIRLCYYGNLGAVIQDYTVVQLGNAAVPGPTFTFSYPITLASLSEIGIYITTNNGGGPALGAVSAGSKSCHAMRIG
jgi:hypothetical protein